jgi:hypothetical protein
MKTILNKVIGVFVAFTVLLVPIVGTFILPTDASADTTVHVTLAKYIDGVPATSTNASSTDFTFRGTATTTLGWAPYTLNVSNGYQITSDEFATSSPYTAFETTSDGSPIATSCTSGGDRFVLSGYTTGSTLAEAAAGTPTTTIPEFTLNSNRAIIIWNHDCMATTTPTATTTARVHIMKYLDGVPATASSSSSYSFPFNATWMASNLNGGATTTGTFVLGTGGVYSGDTVDLNTGSYYTFSENTTSTSTQVLPYGSACEVGKYRQAGYSISTLGFPAAATSTVQSTAPTFNSLNGDQYVIVHNTLCTTANSTTSDALHVTVTTEKSSGVADNTYENGWRYVFHVTAPTGENKVSLKFSDWMGAASSTLPVAGNMRISSAQANNSGAWITLNAANTYSTPELVMNNDLDSSAAGRQFDVVVEVKIPTGTANTSYTTNYGVQTLP